MRACRHLQKLSNRYARGEPREIGQIDEHSNGPLRLPPHPVRVARAGRPLTRVEQTNQRVKFVRERHGRPRHPSRSEVAVGGWAVDLDPNRLVVVIDRLPDSLGFTLFTGVHAAHHALQLWKLTHHLRGQVGLGEETCALRGRGGCLVGAKHLLSDAPGQGAGSLRLLAIAAQFLVKQEGVQTSQTVLESPPTIRIQKEPGVAESGHEHSLGISSDPRHVVTRRIGHGEKVGLQPASPIGHGKIVLMMNHRRFQHFGGELQKLIWERTGHDRWILDQVGDLVQERAPVGVERHAAAHACGAGLELSRNTRPARLSVEDDVVGPECPLVVSE